MQAFIVKKSLRLALAVIFRQTCIYIMHLRSFSQHLNVTILLKTGNLQYKYEMIQIGEMKNELRFFFLNSRGRALLLTLLVQHAMLLASVTVSRRKVMMAAGEDFEIEDAKSCF